MKTKFIIIAVCFYSISVKAQTPTLVESGFETAIIDSSRVMNGSTGETEFTETVYGSKFNFPIFYDTIYKYWSGGWAISRKYDSATVASDFNRHLYCNKAFSGHQSSNTFAIGTQGSYFTQKGASGFLNGIRITNNTYAYNSMKFGDAFAKKFGGTTGNDSDYLLLTAYHYSAGLLIDSSKIYLADFRFTNNSNDFILNNWQFLKLSGDSVVFMLSGSDMGQFGLNTPAYFAVDAIEGWVVSVKNLKKIELRIYPNPVKNLLHIQATSAIKSVEIMDLSGKIIESDQAIISDQTATFNTAGISDGIYFLQVITAAGTGSEKIIIQK